MMQLAAGPVKPFLAALGHIEGHGCELIGRHAEGKRSSR
jgi:hypothetical protein